MRAHELNETTATVAIPDNPFVTEAWQEIFCATIFRVATTQLIPERDGYRLLAIAALSTLLTHEILSEFRGGEDIIAQLRALRVDLETRNIAEEAEPPTLAEMTVVMEMSATALSLLDARRANICPDSPDLETASFAKALLDVARWACDKGGVRTVASTLQGIYGFKQLRN